MKNSPVHFYNSSRIDELQCRKVNFVTHHHEVFFSNFFLFVLMLDVVYSWFIKLSRNNNSSFYIPFHQNVIEQSILYIYFFYHHLW